MAKNVEGASDMFYGYNETLLLCRNECKIDFEPTMNANIFSNETAIEDEYHSDECHLCHYYDSVDPRITKCNFWYRVSLVTLKIKHNSNSVLKQNAYSMLYAKTWSPCKLAENLWHACLEYKNPT